MMVVAAVVVVMMVGLCVVLWCALCVTRITLHTRYGTTVTQSVRVDNCCGKTTTGMQRTCVRTIVFCE